MADRERTDREHGGGEAAKGVAAPDAHGYEPPRLVVIGSVEELTQGGGGGVTDAQEMLS
jgi:hypothetical protein